MVLHTSRHVGILQNIRIGKLSAAKLRALRPQYVGFSTSLIHHYDQIDSAPHIKATIHEIITAARNEAKLSTKMAMFRGGSPSLLDLQRKLISFRDEMATLRRLMIKIAKDLAKYNYLASRRLFWWTLDQQLELADIWDIFVEVKRSSCVFYIASDFYWSRTE